MFKRHLMTVHNKLYGDRELTAYVLDGVGVARVTRDTWGVFHVAGGVEVYYKLQRPKLAQAKDVAAQVAALDVDWTRDPGDRKFDEQFRAAVGAIRAIADGATT